MRKERQELADSSVAEPDRRILRILQEDGRITNQELASRCGMSPSACLERVRRLQANGYIRHYAALLDPQRLGLGFLVFVEVLLERTTGELFQQFSEAVAKHPEIQECHMVAGGFDYLLKLRTADMAAYRHFLVDVLAEFPGVRETRTYAVMQEVKNSHAIMI
jgi:Lrp/AsnC family leucine-responsive transcriptional regulator